MNLEEALKAQEVQVDDLLKTANKYLGTLKSWKKACQIGHIGNLQKSMTQVNELAPALVGPASEAAQAWTFDIRDYLENGQWRQELQQAAAESSAFVCWKRETLVSSPVVVRAQAGRGTLQIGKTTWPALRPSVVAAELKRLRDRTQAANSQEFLEGLYGATRQLNQINQANESEKPFGKFKEIYDLFCITPGYKKDTPPAAFGQAIYALHRSEVRTTRSGRKFELEYPSGSFKERDVFSVIAEDGRPVRYYGIQFL